MDDTGLEISLIWHPVIKILNEEHEQELENAKAFRRSINAPPYKKSILKRQCSYTPWYDVEQAWHEFEKVNKLWEEESFNYNEIKENHEARYENLRKSEEELCQLFKDITDTFQTSKMRRLRALKDLELCKEEIRIKSKEFEKLEKELKLCYKTKEVMMTRLEQCEIVKSFLQDLVKYSKNMNVHDPNYSKNNDFEEILDIIDRYRLLKEIRDNKLNELMEKQETEVEMVLSEEKKQQEQKDKMLKDKCLLVKLDKKHFTASLRNQTLQENLEFLKTSRKKEILQIYLAKAAIYDLYLCLCEQTKQPAKISKKNLRAQLAFIKRFLNEIKKVRITVEDFLREDSDLPDEHAERTRTLDQNKKIGKLTRKSFSYDDSVS